MEHAGPSLCPKYVPRYALYVPPQDFCSCCFFCSLQLLKILQGFVSLKKYFIPTILLSGHNNPMRQVIAVISHIRNWQVQGMKRLVQASELIYGIWSSPLSILQIQWLSICESLWSLQTDVDVGTWSPRFESWHLLLACDTSLSLLLIQYMPQFLHMQNGNNHSLNLKRLRGVDELLCKVLRTMAGIK